MRRLVLIENWSGADLVRWRKAQAGDHKHRNKQRREGWTQAKAAQWFGCSTRQWQRYEAETTEIPASLVLRIRSYEQGFAKSVDQIFDSSPAQLARQGGPFPELAAEKRRLDGHDG